MNGKAERFLAAAAQAPDAGIWVEVGCVRIPEELQSEGWSTVHLSVAAGGRGIPFYSVDKDANALMVAQESVQAHGDGHKTTFVLDTGREFLGRNEQAIGFLYLDGGGGPGETLAEFMEAERLLRGNAIVAIDDCQSHGGFVHGKGTDLIPYLISGGWNVEWFDTGGEYKMVVADRRGTELPDMHQRCAKETACPT